ncbi:hypothetical protein M9458_053295, partial [Cirrhinus mrigala]
MSNPVSSSILLVQISDVDHEVSHIVAEHFSESIRTLPPEYPVTLKHLTAP